MARALECPACGPATGWTTSPTADTFRCEPLRSGAQGPHPGQLVTARAVRRHRRASRAPPARTGGAPARAAADACDRERPAGDGGTRDAAPVRTAAGGVGHRRCRRTVDDADGRRRPGSPVPRRRGRSAAAPAKRRRSRGTGGSAGVDRRGARSGSSSPRGRPTSSGSSRRTTCSTSSSAPAPAATSASRSSPGVGARHRAARAAASSRAVAARADRRRRRAPVPRHERPASAARRAGTSPASTSSASRRTRAFHHFSVGGDLTRRGRRGARRDGRDGHLPLVRRVRRHDRRAGDRGLRRLSAGAGQPE